MSAGITQWGQVSFFDKEIIKKKDGKPFEDLKGTSVIGCASTNGFGDGQLIFGIPDGAICIVNRDYETNYAPIFDSSLQLLTHSSADTLAVVGMDRPDGKQSIKLFKTHKSLIERDSVQPGKIIAPAANEHPSSKITAIAITERHIALGCENGSIYFFSSNDLMKEKRLKFSPPFYTGESSITNLAFAEITKSHSDVVIFATMESKVLSFRLIPSSINPITTATGLSSAVAVATSVSTSLTSTLRDRRPFHLNSSHQQHQQQSAAAQFTMTVLEPTSGCAAGCSVLTPPEYTEEQQFFIGNSLGVFSYVADDKRVGLAIDGEKLSIHWWFNYLIIVKKENRKPAFNSSNKPLTGPSTMKAQSDILSKLTANSGAAELQTLVVYDTSLQLTAFSVGIPRIQCVLNEWGYIHILTGDGELHRLVERDLHSRLNLLFRKNRYQSAIQLAKKNRTSKQGMAEIFKQFGDHLYGRNEFETATAQYCQTIGFLEPSYVIKKFLDSQHIDHLTRYLEELHRQKLANADHTTLLLNCYTKHPDRINRLSQFIGLNENLSSNIDNELTFDVNIAIDVCRQAGYFEQALALSAKYRRHDKYIKIQIENLNEYKKALIYIEKLTFDDAVQAFRNYGKTLMKHEPKLTTQLLKQLKPTAAQFEQEQLPESLFSLFMSHPDEFLDYLEHVVKQNSKENIPSTVYDTLLELLLQKYNSNGTKKEHEESTNKILDLLKDTKVNIDVSRALMACQKYNFKLGVICLYDRAKLYQQILQYQMDNNDIDEIVATCEKYGADDPQLWVQALSYFSKLKKSDGCQKEIQRILKYIEQQDLLSPLLVVQTLSNNESTTLDLLKDYLIKKLRSEQEQIERDQNDIQSYRQGSALILDKIQKLETEPILCQDPKCSACKMDLDIPCIHFFCEHSFHEHCAAAFELANSEIGYECPLCSGENRKWLDLIDNQRVGNNTHETFHHELEDRRDKFGVVAEYLGRKLFDKD